LFTLCCGLFNIGFAQTDFKLKFKRSTIYAGIEVGSKGVKLSVLEVGKNAQNNGTFNMLKDTSVNTDFISFNQSTFSATLNGLEQLFVKATDEYRIASENIYTVISSGVTGQAEKDAKQPMLHALIDSFKIRIKEPQRMVALVDVAEEARLSHLGIVPEAKRYSTFLIDIGSGNTKGGYFPNGNTKDIKLFQITWGTKSVANGTEKRLEDDKSLTNYKKQLYRVLEGSANTEIIYAVNVSGAYNMSDNIAFSGGIAWSVATLIFPELLENPVVPVTYDEVLAFSERLYENYTAYNNTVITAKLRDNSLDKNAISEEIKRVHKVFDQKSLMAGTGLLLKIMRQFEGVYEKKQFFLVKNGQVGWISAYVDQHIKN
ncbi:MAG TPA: ROK family protein, partial [Ferruginibacter sp.]|nr:ROK family protein [Ferruginibacter sp.]